MRKKRVRKIFDNIEVLDAAAKGKCIAKAPDGRVIFLSNVVPGDICDIQTTKKRKAYYEGVPVRFHHLSSQRVEPECKHFGVCGGCKWQNMGYQHQLKYKQSEVTNNLQRIGHLDLPKEEPIAGSKKTYFYRNKMEFSFSNNRWLSLEEITSENEIENRNALGFHIPGMWDKILDIEKCHLQADPSNALRLFIKEFAEKNSISFFNPREHSGELRTLMIRTSSTGEVMVLLQFYADNETNRSLLLKNLKERFPEITSLLYVINRKGNDTIYDQEIHCYHGRDYIVEKMEELEFKITAKSFYQTNSDQAYELYKITREFAGLTGKEVVYDLYTGIGTIALFVASKAAKVIGIEAIPDAILAANSNAMDNGIENVKFFSGDMKNIFNDSLIEQEGRPEVIITDPPRDGMHKQVVEQILQIAPERIVYVSCNSATQARDLALMDTSYKIIKSQAVDMFPQTHHVENVVLLKKRNL
ncbi:23S rRNA (uracil(1939)-C(5))-methyltransferase RlmD [Eudoraea chungangensis]|uniref:23S rRNA (uracil(1939)-C(5))-methyltransferase RlmD n=1 Tax=Eudoraea chungangensis TaxID=1481905 RepID=UPI0023EDF98D|nr:23S rRNA (uracil(1939)-C(5))-methyltransferase RlmD [Eudoraea chungangensis]